VTVTPGAPRVVDRTAPTTGEVIRRGTEVGLGALGLAGRAAGSLLARVPTARREAADLDTPPPAPGLVPGALAGMVIVSERVAQVVLDEVLERSAGVARTFTRPTVVRRSLRPLEELMWRFNDIARREQDRNRAEAATVIPLVIQRVTENVVAQIDFVSVVQQVPVDEIVANLDMEAIIARIDLPGVIRESTASVSSEVTDAMRERTMALDAFAARVVDRMLFRKRARQLDVGPAS
jgi:hypothetical protein